MDKNVQQQLNTLQQALEQLRAEFYRNNSSSTQDFNKRVNFNTRMSVPHFTALPTTCEVGEIGEFSGKLYICSAANTWTLVGSQV